MEKQNRRRKEGGFTMVEMIVVLAILGILAAILVPKFTDHLRKAEATGALAQAKAIKEAVIAFRQDVGRLPNSLNELYDGTAPNGKVYTDPISPATGTAVALKQVPNFQLALGGGAGGVAGGGAAGGGVNAVVLEYQGVDPEVALIMDTKADKTKTPNTGMVHVVRAGGAGVGGGAANGLKVQVFLMTANAY